MRLGPSRHRSYDARRGVVGGGSGEVRGGGDRNRFRPDSAFIRLLKSLGRGIPSGESLLLSQRWNLSRTMGRELGGWK